MDINVGPRTFTDLGWWMARAMADRDLSQTELAAKIGVKQGTISRWMHEPRRPNLDALRRLAAALDTPYGEVLTLAGYADDTAPTALQDDPEPDHPIVEKLRLMLDRSTPIPADKLATLEAVLAGVIAPYEQYMTRRRRTG
jgi:transcriptional regulator with XRE-family HTH domain